MLMMDQYLAIYSPAPAHDCHVRGVMTLFWLGLRALERTLAMIRRPSGDSSEEDAGEGREGV